MTSVENHYETPRKSRRAVFLGGAAVLVLLLVLFARWTLPSQPTELVGSWVGKKDSHATIELRSDGTYSSCLKFDPYDPGRNFLIVTEGTWKATHDSLYLNPSKVERGQPIKDKRNFDDAREELLGHSVKLRMNWNSRTEWFLAGQQDNPFVRRQ